MLLRINETSKHFRTTFLLLIYIIIIKCRQGVNSATFSWCCSFELLCLISFLEFQNCKFWKALVITEVAIRDLPISIKTTVMRRGEDGELLAIPLCGLKGTPFLWADADRSVRCVVYHHAQFTQVDGVLPWGHKTPLNPKQHPFHVPISCCNSYLQNQNYWTIFLRHWHLLVLNDEVDLWTYIICKKVIFLAFN